MSEVRSMNRYNPTAATAIALVFWERQAKLARDTGWSTRAEMYQSRINEAMAGVGDREGLREAIAEIRAKEDRVFV